MDFEQQYEVVRPYKDHEVPEKLNEILGRDEFKHVVSFLYSNMDINKALEQFSNIKTVAEFQSVFSHHAVREVVRKTSDGLTYSGLDSLDKNKAYLFIANHRDIVLDSAIMQVLLVENNHRTSQITFGSNLMSSDFIIHLGKLNKMFTFYRGGSRIQMYRNALLHSEYIRHVIVEENESLWIAQRDGRTKDGKDKTQEALIKMLAMGKPDVSVALKELNIVPVSISYEYEPCDVGKIQERYISKTEPYVKKSGEDLNSILTGIKGYKGHIHMAFGEPLNSVIEKCKLDNVDDSKLVKVVVDSIDKQLYKNFALWPCNYIAYDYITKNNSFCNEKYTEEQKNEFVNYVNSKVLLMQGDKKELTEMFFNLYAMPVFSSIENS